MKQCVAKIGVLSCLVLVASCGGSGGSGGAGPPAAPPASTGQVTPTASQTQAIAAATGGTISVGSGATLLTLVIPPHALAADATVTVSEFDTAVPQPSGASASAALPGGATFLGGFTVTTGGVALIEPLQVSQAPVTPAAGGTAYLAMYGPASGRYTVVDTATVASGHVANDDAKAYVGISSAAGASTPYAFYASTAAATPAPIALAIAAATPGPYAIGTTATFAASGVDANHNPYAFTPAFSVSIPAMGTVAPSGTDPSKAVVTFGSTQQNGFVVMTDARSGLRASVNVSVQSARPANDGDTYAYSGTLTQEFDRMLPDAMPPSTTSAAVTQSVTVHGGQNFHGIQNVYDFDTNETDATTLQTTISESHAYEGFAASGAVTQFVQYGSSWQDGAGNSLAYLYPQAPVLDELPGSPGRTWSNTAAASITENDTLGALGAAFASQRVYAADGTYAETSSYPPGYFNAGSPADHGSIVENADGSGIDSVPIFGAGAVVFSAPLNGTISYSVYGVATPQPTDVPFLTAQIPVWYATPTPVLYAESDADNGSAAIPAECTSSPSFGTTAQQHVQTIDRTDTILGYLEHTTTTTYLVPGYGAVCIELADAQTYYYDFQGDSTSLFYGQPFQKNTVREVLGLQQTGTNVIGASAAARQVASRALYRLVGTSAFARTLATNRTERERAFATSLRRTTQMQKRGIK